MVHYQWLWGSIVGIGLFVLMILFNKWKLDETPIGKAFTAYRQKTLIVMISLSAVYFVIYYFIMNYTYPTLSQDSWSYYELSKNIFTDFYRVNNYRHAQYVDLYGTSFPPLYSVLLAIINAIFDLGIYAGYWLNFILLIPIAMILIKLGQRFREEPAEGALLGLILFVGLLMNMRFMDEVSAARSGILAVTLQIAALTVILKKDAYKLKDYLIIGVITGFILLNRFDYLFAGLFTGVIMLLINVWVHKQKGKANLLPMILYYVTVFAIISPWMIYSLSHFDKLFISDNGRAFTLISYSAVTDYFPYPDQLETMSTNFPQWIRAVIWRSIRISGNIGYYTYHHTLKDILYIPGGLFLIALFIRHKKAGFRMIWDKVKESPNKYIRLGVVILITLISIFPNFVGAFADARYFMVFHIVTLLMVILLGELFFETAFQGKPQMVRYAYYGLIILTFIVFDIFANFTDWKTKRHDLIRNAYYLEPIDFASLNQTIKAIGKDEVRLICFQQEMDAYRFAALTGTVTMPAPYNVSNETVPLLVDEFDLNYIYITDKTRREEWLAAIRTEFEVTNTSLNGLYHIILPQDEAVSE